MASRLFTSAVLALLASTALNPLLALDKSKIDPELWTAIKNSNKSARNFTFIVEMKGLDGLTLQNFNGDKGQFKRALNDQHSTQSQRLNHLAWPLKETGHLQSIQPLWIAPYQIVNGTAEAVKQLTDIPEVEYIYADREYTLPQPIKAKTKDAGPATYGLKKINAQGAWDQGANGQGIVVGILDTGIDSTHPDLKGKILAFKNVTDDQGSSAGFDGQGHGSHTSGTIVGGNAGGTAIGVAPQAKLMVGKIFTASGKTKLSWILNAMQWIGDPDSNLETDDGPAVCSNSWGGQQSAMAQEKPMWDIVAKWRELGIVPVFANGNSGPKPSTTGTPGGYPHTFAVGATNSADAIARFSSRGPITWEGVKYIKPDISAPGEGVTSVKDGGGYATYSGTSMACPHIAGVCALVLSANPKLSVAQVIQIIQETSLDLGSSGKDNDFGFGRADASKAVAKAKALAEQEANNPSK